jgi:hypothetical protein
MTFQLPPTSSRRAVSALVLAVLPFLAPSTPLAAQDSLPLAPGAHVRIWAPTLSEHKQVAEVVAVRGDTLMLHTSDGGWVLPLANVRSLEVSRGRRSSGERLARGAGFGLLIGGGLGVLLGALTPLTGEAADVDRGDWVLFGGLTGGASGAVIGGLVGVAIPGDRWQQVPLRRRVSVVPGWSRKKGLGLIASVAF